MRFLTLAALLANAAFTSTIGSILRVGGIILRGQHSHHKEHKERAVIGHGPHDIPIVSEDPTGIDVAIFADAPILIPTTMPAVVDDKKEMLKVLSKINHATLAPEVTTTARTLVTRVQPRAVASPTDGIPFFNLSELVSMAVARYYYTLAPEVPTSTEPTRTLVTRVHAREFPTDKAMQEDVEKWHSWWKDLKAELATDGEPMSMSPQEMLERYASLFPFDAYTNHVAREAEATPTASSEVPDYVYEVFSSILNQGPPTPSPTTASGLSPRTPETRVKETVALSSSSSSSTEATAGLFDPSDRPAPWKCSHGGRYSPPLFCEDVGKAEGAEE